MRNLFLILAASLLAASCTTMQSAQKTINIHTTSPALIVHQDDTINTLNNKAAIVTPIPPANITIQTITGNIKKTVTISQKINADYYAGNIATLGLLSLTSKKEDKLVYPVHIYINNNDTLNQYKTYPAFDRKGNIHLQLSAPMLYSIFRFKPEGEGMKEAIGVWGLNAGLTWHHQNNQFLSLTFGANTDQLGEYFGNFTRISTVGWNLANNHHIGRFSVGYGLAYARNQWKFSNGGSDSTVTRPSVVKNARVLGLAIPVYFQPSRYFYIGATYRPTFIGLSPGVSSRYEHLITIEAAWRIRLVK